MLLQTENRRQEKKNQNWRKSRREKIIFVPGAASDQYDVVDGGLVQLCIPHRLLHRLQRALEAGVGKNSPEVLLGFLVFFCGFFGFFWGFFFFFGFFGLF
jgi:hypothetical protein